MQDKETRKKLIQSAKQEFMQQGYLKASLRKICKNAGVTTGALYFFFQDKEDLFATIVKEPIEQITTMMKEHFDEEKQIINNGMVYKEDHEVDRHIANSVLHILYTYKEEFLLVLTKSQGTRFEDTINQIVDYAQSHYREMADKTVLKYNQDPVDDFTIHWISHTQVDVFLHMLTHVETEEEAQKCMVPIIKYMIGGWYAMFGIQR